MGQQYPGKHDAPHQKKFVKQAGLYVCLYGINFPEEAGLRICLVF